MADTTAIKTSCMCGASNHTFTVPNSSLPLSTHLCSCNISRRISGSLLTSYVNIPSNADNPKPDLTNLTGYKSSNILARHFCTTCGTQMYLEYNHDGHFEVATGTLQLKNTEGIVDIKAHIWVEDSRDGGASEFVPKIDGKQLKRFLTEPGQSEEVPLGWKAPGTHVKDLDESDKLYAHCHCKGTEFWISRAGEQSKNAESPFPDLLIPYHSHSSANPENVPWWLPREDRFLAGTCACNSCRRSSGFEITCWAFVPTIDITLKDGVPFQRNPYWGTMKTYRSSPNVTRAFCGKCGCTIFWDGDERPTIIDVAVGLLDADSGARAEEWLAWRTERVSFTEDAVNRQLIAGLEEGLKDWKEKNQGSKSLASGHFWGTFQSGNP